MADPGFPVGTGKRMLTICFGNLSELKMVHGVGTNEGPSKSVNGDDRMMVLLFLTYHIYLHLTH